uniref:Uncharacterized protein n=1 Tax=Glossina palpalis gambiensis TaxID=67801 RepID=A0A1B0BIW2_9MUSC
MTILTDNRDVNKLYACLPLKYVGRNQNKSKCETNAIKQLALAEMKITAIEELLFNCCMLLLLCRTITFFRSIKKLGKEQ